MSELRLQRGLKTVSRAYVSDLFYDSVEAQGYEADRTEIPRLMAQIAVCPLEPNRQEAGSPDNYERSRESRARRLRLESALSRLARDSYVVSNTISNQHATTNRGQSTVVVFGSADVQLELLRQKVFDEYSQKYELDTLQDSDIGSLIGLAHVNLHPLIHSIERRLLVDHTDSTWREFLTLVAKSMDITLEEQREQLHMEGRVDVLRTN